MFQTLYPRHCVQETYGAKLHEKLRLPDDAFFTTKGEKTYVGSYSAFYDNSRNPLNVLKDRLDEDNIKVVLGCGLAYDICVRHPLDDANHLEFYSAVVRDASKGVMVDSIKAADELFELKKIAILNETTAKSVISGQKIPKEWLLKFLEEKPLDEHQ
ncbi:unnamed protein product [Strongylus vulgaris]|uniref:nicotinamidase n=1 Tax=Strongylus vulgaris TaxID=40348 RepID=A0A3P7IM79_STRVU|nr:unnamed protein product [Strongylus vulgaris]